MRRAALLLSVLLAGCATERMIALAIEPPRDGMGGPMIPTDAVSWEVRVVRLGDDDLCPSVEAAAEARAFGELADAQSFMVGGTGAAVGELPSGRWAFSALARDVGCAPLLYGCEIATLEGEDTPDVVIPVEPVTTAATCGCRSCTDGECVEVQRVCN